VDDWLGVEDREGAAELEDVGDGERLTVEENEIVSLMVGVTLMVAGDCERDPETLIVAVTEALTDNVPVVEVLPLGVLVEEWLGETETLGVEVVVLDGVRLRLGVAVILGDEVIVLDSVFVAVMVRDLLGVTLCVTERDPVAVTVVDGVRLWVDVAVILGDGVTVIDGGCVCVADIVRDLLGVTLDVTE